MIAISIPPEDNTYIYRDSQLALLMQRLEEEDVQNMDKKENVIMRDGEFATMMQHQEEEKAHKLMDKEQRSM